MKKKNLEWFKKTINILEKNKIWYTVDSGTLLGTIRESGPIAWDDDFDIIMTPVSYEKLKKLYPSNCLDGTISKKYPLIYPKFVPSNQENDFLSSPIFVDIFLLVETSEKKIKKFRSFKNKIFFTTETLHTTWKPYAWYMWIAFVLTYPLFWIFNTKLDHKKIISLIEEKGTNIYYMVDNPVENAERNTIINYSFNRMKKSFDKFDVQVPVNFDDVLKTEYGKNYMIPNKSVKPFTHINAVSVKKNKPN